MIITEQNFSLFARAIAAPAEPDDFNQEAINRLMDKMDEYVVRVKGVHPQFKAHNKTALISFQNKEDREYYERAYERYLEEKAKIEAMHGISGVQSRFQILVEFLKFRQAAEYVRAPYLARLMWEAVVKEDKAAVCAANFRPTITRAAMILMHDYNIPRDLISLIWGGAQVTQTKKGKLKKQILETEGLEELLEAQGISLEDLKLGDNVEVKEEVHYDPALRMGSQNQETRQVEIDRFQKGLSRYCFFTFKAGGVGLSLHHTDEYTAFKCRRKESGYVFEEDIPNVSTRPRKTFLSPTYSAIESVQGLGRAPRLTSLSDTEQIIIYFRGTIEERVKAIMDMKLRCLSKVTRMKESWEDIAIVKDPEKYFNDMSKQNPKDDDEDDDGEILGNTESD